MIIKPSYERFRDAKSDGPSRKLGYLYGTIITLCDKTSDKRAIVHCVEAALDTLNPEDPYEKSIIQLFRDALKNHNITVE